MRSCRPTFIEPMTGSTWLIAALYLSVVEGEPGQLLRLHESGGWSLISLLDSQRPRPDGHKQPFTSYNPKRPRQDSNLRHRLRRPVLYPLSYGGKSRGRS
jgi:hypothetical protein